jgi:hypothetical protein
VYSGGYSIAVCWFSSHFLNSHHQSITTVLAFSQQLSKQGAQRMPFLAGTLDGVLTSVIRIKQCSLYHVYKWNAMIQLFGERQLCCVRRRGRQISCRAAVDEVQTSAPQSTSRSAKSPSQPVDNALKDLSQVLLPTSDESDQLLRIRHSCAHLMAMAMQRVHKGTQVTIGPWTDNGFYYDFDMSNSEPFTEKQLKKVKKEMRRLMRKNLPFMREEVTADEARRRITELGEPYKLEILDSILERYASTPLHLLQHFSLPHFPEQLSDHGAHTIADCATTLSTNPIAFSQHLHEISSKFGTNQTPSQRHH